MISGNTTAQLPVGSADPYTDVSIDSGVTWQPAILAGNHPWAEPTGTNSWVNCPSSTADPLGSCSNAFPVLSFFRYRFWIASDFSNGTLAGEFNVDNYAKFYINGVDSAHCFLGCNANGNLGFAGGGTSTIAANNGGQPAAINSLLQAGWNTFYVVLVDTGGLSGIAYNLQLLINSATPITVAAPGTLVVFDAQQGTASAAIATVAFNQALSTITMPTATRAGYIFDGWYTAASGGTLVDATYAAATTPTTDITLYAHWTPEPNVVTFDPQSGTASAATASVSYNQTLASITMPTATRAGFTFEGWYTAASGGTLVDSAYAASFTPTSALTLYARWAAVPTVVVNPSQVSTTSTQLAKTGFVYTNELLAAILLILGIALIAFARKTQKVS